MGLTLFVAIVVHAMVILGVGFKFEKPTKQPSPERTLEIMVVRNPTKPEKPTEADFLAQMNQQGGGNEKEKEKTDYSADAPGSAAGRTAISTDATIPGTAGRTRNPGGADPSGSGKEENGGCRT